MASGTTLQGVNFSPLEPAFYGASKHGIRGFPAPFLSVFDTTIRV